MYITKFKYNKFCVYRIYICILLGYLSLNLFYNISIYNEWDFRERGINSLYNTRYLIINSSLLNLPTNILSAEDETKDRLTIQWNEWNISYSTANHFFSEKVLHRKELFAFTFSNPFHSFFCAHSSSSSSSPRRNATIKSIERIDQFRESRKRYDDIPPIPRLGAIDSTVYTASRFRLFSRETIFATELKACSLDEVDSIESSAIQRRRRAAVSRWGGTISSTRDFRFIHARCIAAKGAIRQTGGVNRRVARRRGGARILRDLRLAPLAGEESVGGARDALGAACWISIRRNSRQPDAVRDAKSWSPEQLVASVTDPAPTIPDEAEDNLPPQSIPWQRFKPLPRSNIFQLCG